MRGRHPTLRSRDIASALFLSEGGPRAKQHRARQKLRTIYEELSDGGSLLPERDG